MDGSALRLELGDEADGSQWTTQRWRDGRLTLSDEADGSRLMARRWRYDGVLKGLGVGARAWR